MNRAQESLYVSSFQPKKGKLLSGSRGGCWLKRLKISKNGSTALLIYASPPIPHLSLSIFVSLHTAALIPAGEEVQFGFGHSHSVCLPTQHGTGLSGE